MGKNGLLEHKSGNISGTHKDRKKRYYGEPIGTHLRSFERYHPRPPTASPPLLTIISGTGKAMNFKFGQYIQRVHPNKSPLKISEKRERGRIQGLPKFFGYPLLSQEWGKLQFLQRVSIACYAERCISYRKSVRLSVCPSVCPSHVGNVSKRLKLRSWGPVSYTHLTLPTKRIV